MLTRSAVLVALVILLILAGCTVTFVSDYDEQIDRGLTQLNTDLGIFINKMVQAAGTPPGTYEENKDFYNTEKPKVDSLVMRAQAHKVLDSCPSTSLIKAVLDRLPTSQSTLTPNTDVNQIIASLPQDDCSVVLISQVRAGLGDLEAFHKAQGKLGVPRSARDPIVVGGLGAIIRAAVTVQIALKAGATTTGGK